MDEQLIHLLNEKAALYEQPGFIKDDPISIPHRFTKKQDIEIAGFFTAILAWGKRKSIIDSCEFLFMLMDDAPYDFIMNYDDDDLIPFMDFVHRTFNASDLIHFLDFLQFHYQYLEEESLETAFSKHLKPTDKDVAPALTGFYNSFFDDSYFGDYDERTKKHIATPAKKSACKRLNMFLRWMVRSNEKGVDFGIWKNIQPSQLVCPLDIHVSRMSRQLGLLTRKQNDWIAATELTENLKLLDANDPVKYDFALFGMGLEEKSIGK